MFTEMQRIIFGSWFILSMSCLFFPFLANNFLPTKMAMSLIFSNIFSFAIFIGIINLLLEIVIIPFILVKNAITKRKKLTKRTKESLEANKIEEPIENVVNNLNISTATSLESNTSEINENRQNTEQISEIKSLDNTLERLKKLNKTLEENRKRRLSEDLTKSPSMKTNFKFDKKEGRD